MSTPNTTSPVATNCHQSVTYGGDDKEISDQIFEWCRDGNTAALEKNCGYLDVRDQAKASPLHHATAEGHVGIIRLLVETAGLEVLHSVDSEGNTPLHWAVKRNQRLSCVTLLGLWADPNLLNNGLMSPLHLAVSLRYNDLVQLLLSHSATDVNLEGDVGNTPAMLACSIDNHEALQMLFKHGAKMCHQNKLGHYCIHAAAFAGAKRCMEVVLQKGEEMGHSAEVHINCVDKSFCSPLHLAVRGGNLEVIKFCIERGACINQQQCDKLSALHFACTQGAIEVVTLMLSTYGKTCDIINIRDGANQTPLHKATLFDHHELAECLIAKGADVNATDCRGHTPLLLATTCSAWRTVNLLLSSGANPKSRDRSGCNFLHLAILQPKGLKNLSNEVLQLSGVKELLHAEDNDGCTPLHYACKLGVPEAVNNMLGLHVSLDHKSKQKKSALHFATEYGRINTCKRLLDNMADTRLLNEGDERGMTPLHLASRGGHVQVVELLLRKGALFHSDYKGWTSLHHAASEGYTKTMNILLDSNIKLLDKTDEDGDTALHLCSREDHTAGVLLLLDRGAKLLLNKMDASFLHEAILHGKKETVDAIVRSERCSEAILTFKWNSLRGCAVTEMIEALPESYKTLLDTCIKESEEDVNSPNYCIEYNFIWLQAPMKYVKLAKTEKSTKLKPLAALNTMVQFNRVELLTHPLCKKYLEMKWEAYGIVAHMLNLGIYSLGLLPLTHLIVKLKPVIIHNDTSSNSTPQVHMATKPWDEQCSVVTTCMFIVLAMNLYAVGKELVQITQKRSAYCRDISNLLDWLAAVFSLLFVIPLMLDARHNWHWEAGALAVLISWINFLFYLQRFERFGIYVVMFSEICKTLLSIIVVFFYLILAFALSFYALIIDHTYLFEQWSLSIMQTFVMMAGELNYQDNILKPFLSNKLPFPLLTYVIFIWFVLLVPILLMNLLIGLAVGDIAEVQSNAVLKQIGMQIELHTSLEEKLPYWLLKRVDHDTITEYPNKKCRKKGLLSFMDTETMRTRLHCGAQEVLPLEREIRKQKYKLKEISDVLNKQYNLLRLVIQKMEISAEAEENDGPQLSQGYRQWEKLRAPLSNSSANNSMWDPLVKAIAAKQM